MAGDSGYKQELGLLVAAIGDNLHLSINAPIGTELDIKIHDVHSHEVRQLGASGIITNQREENLDFSADGLADGAYFIALKSKCGDVQVPVFISK